MTDHRKDAFAAVAEKLQGVWSLAGTIPLMDKIVDLWDASNDNAPVAAPVQAGAPAWISVARKLVGTREIPGPQNNGFIAKGWARLGASWFNDDETPWCGFFVAHCMDAAGMPIPGKGAFARAKAWLDWGKPSQPVLGAVVVFTRKGGGHVGFLVGESTTHYYVLGGNQDNCVSITPFNKATRPPEGFRWPASLPAGTTKLPKMSGGTVTTSEA